MKKFLIAALALALVVVSAWGCGNGGVGGNESSTPAPGERTARSGDTVSVHYTGKLEDGTQFESSIGKDPFVFTLGKGEVIPGFEDAVLGMKVGESKTVTLPPDEAYGPHRDELVIDVPRSEFPAEVKVGDRYRMQQADGSEIYVTVVEINEDTVKVDANPRLAGKTLIFEIQLVEIR